jgi:choline kinase
MSIRAVLLAAGTGNRLRPYTNDRPKCLVELFGVPLLHRQLAVVRDAGITDITVVGGFAADRLADPGYRLVVNPAYESTNMVASLFCAGDVMRDDADLLVTYGDIVYEPSVLAAILDSRSPLSIVSDRGWRAYWEARMADPLSDTETFKLAAGGRVTEIGRKPRNYAEIQGQYIGLTKVRADYVRAFVDARAGMPHDGVFNGKSRDRIDMTSFLQYLVEAGWPLDAVEVEHGWLEVDSVEDLRRYEEMRAAGTLAPLYDESGGHGDRRAVPPAPS